MILLPGWSGVGCKLPRG